LTNRYAISIGVLFLLAVVVSLVGSRGRGEVAAAVAERSPIDEIRRFRVDYEVEIAARPSGDGTLHLFVPIASDT
jgi:hypothetical protein